MRLHAQDFRAHYRLILPPDLPPELAPCGGKSRDEATRLTLKSDRFSGSNGTARYGAERVATHYKTAALTLCYPEFSSGISIRNSSGHGIGHELPITGREAKG
jgi:hypothetical protein